MTNATALSKFETVSSAPNGGHDDVLSLLRSLDVRLVRLEDLLQNLCQRKKDFYTVQEVGEAAGRTAYTVRRWVRDGLISATRIDGTGPHGRLLIARQELERLIASGLGESVPTAALD